MWSFWYLIPTGLCSTTWEQWLCSIERLQDSLVLHTPIPAPVIWVSVAQQQEHLPRCSWACGFESQLSLKKKASHSFLWLTSLLTSLKLGYFNAWLWVSHCADLNYRDCNMCSWIWICTYALHNNHHYSTKYMWKFKQMSINGLPVNCRYELKFMTNWIKILVLSFISHLDHTADGSGMITWEIKESTGIFSWSWISIHAYIVCRQSVGLSYKQKSLSTMHSIRYAMKLI